MNKPDRLLNIKELSTFLGLTERTIKSHQKEPGYPKKKLGHRVRYDVEEVLEWYNHHSDLNRQGESK